MSLPGGWGDCHEVGQTVREWGRLSEIRGDCQKVGQTVRDSGRLSESRADCQRVGQTILRSTEEAVRGGYYGPGLQLPTEREA